MELNNFSAAARELKLTVAAVSKHVSHLEQALGVKLLTRTTRKIKLTEIGHQFYIQSQLILRAIEDAEAVIAQTQEEPAGKICIKSDRYFAERFIVPRLKEFYIHYPKVQVELESSERVPDLIGENFDVVFGRTIQNTENIIQRTITTTYFCLCATPYYLKQHGVPHAPKDLVHHHYLSHTTRMPNDQISFGKKEQIYLKPSLLINDSDALLQCALMDMGIVKLQHFVVASALNEGRLVEIMPQYKHPVIPINVFYQPTKYLQAKVKKFIDYICEKLPKTM